STFLQIVLQKGFFSTLASIWGPIFFGSKTAWKIIGCFAAFQLLLMKVVPGKQYFGPITPKGNTPVYKDNGISSFVITMVSFYLAAFQFHWFSPAILYNHLGEILGALNLFSLF